MILLLYYDYYYLFMNTVFGAEKVLKSFMPEDILWERHLIDIEFINKSSSYPSKCNTILGYILVLLIESC